MHVPLLKALALPNPVRTSNAEAHADCLYHPLSTAQAMDKEQGGIKHTRQGIYRCLASDRIFLNLRDSEQSKEQSVPVNAFPCIPSPMHPTASDEASAMGNLGKYTKKCAKEPHPSIKNRTHSRHSGTRQADSPFLPTTGRPIGKVSECQSGCARIAYLRPTGQADGNARFSRT